MQGESAPSREGLYIPTLRRATISNLNRGRNGAGTVSSFPRGLESLPDTVSPLHRWSHVPLPHATQRPQCDG